MRHQLEIITQFFRAALMGRRRPSVAHVLDQKGLTLVEAMVSIAILTIGALAYAYVSAQYHGENEVGTQRRVQAHRILNATANSITSKDFEEIKLFCDKKGAFDQPRTSRCVVNGALQHLDAGQDSETLRDKVVEYSQSWDGTIDNTGHVCVDLLRCENLSQGQTIQLQLVAHWETSGKIFASAPLTFSRGRW